MSLHLLNFGGSTVLFAHIPKTGGTSVSGGRERVISGPVMYEPAPGWPTGLPSLAFVRDPFDRAASAWRDMRYLRQWFGGSLEDFLHLIADADPERVANPAGSEHHGIPMVHPVHGLRHAAFIGRYERLAVDLRRFCEVHGLDCPTLPRLRDSKGVPRGEWTATARRLAERIYAADFELLAGLEAAA